MFADPRRSECAAAVYECSDAIIHTLREEKGDDFLIFGLVVKIAAQSSKSIYICSSSWTPTAGVWSYHAAIIVQ